MIIDSFAGGGGTSTGIEMALGRSPDVAINHSADALALHAANHPDTLHLDSNIWDVDPRSVTKGRRVGLLWASPDCKHFSKAKGGAPKDRNIRDLAWVIVRWMDEVQPDVVTMENVEEFRTWGPIDNEGQPIPEFIGQTFDDWCRRIKRAGYKMQWRELRGCDYGAPTIRKRFFMIARLDGQPIIWPKPTHGDPKSPEVKRGKLKPWRTAAECIDWSTPCPSIFDTAPEIMAKHGLRAIRPLAPNTLARIARGMKRYVIEAERPFLVNLTHGARCEDIADPFRTITGAHRGEKALVAPALATFYGHGDGRGIRSADMSQPLRTVTTENRHALILPHLLSLKGTARRDMPINAPHPTVLAGGGHSALIAPHIMTMRNSGKPFNGADEPTHTITAGGAGLSTVVAFLAQHHTGATGHDLRDPMSTIAATGSHQMPVAAWFAKYYGTGDGARTDEPLHTITTKDRMGHMQAALQAPPFQPEHQARARAVADFLREQGAWDGGEFVTLTIDGSTYVVVDIGMRMLTPRELFNAQGFPPDYQIDGHWVEADGDWTFKPTTKNVQVSCCGNSVCPDLARAIVSANCQHLIAERAAA